MSYSTRYPETHSHNYDTACYIGGWKRLAARVVALGDEVFNGGEDAGFR